MGAAFGPALWGHLVIFTLVASVAWTLRSHAWLEEPASEMGVVWCGESLGSTSCPTMTDNQAVLRVTLAGVVYFLAHAVLTVNVATEEDPRAKLHGGGCAAWTIRVTLLSLLMFLMFLLPATATEYYFETARVLAGFFLVLQIVLLLDFVYELNEKWLADDGGFGMAMLVAASFTTYVGGLVASGFLYHMFASDVDESLNIAIITLTLVAGIGYTLLSLQKRVDAGLMTSGIMFAYTIFLCWNALSSQPPQTQRESDDGQASQRYLKIVSFCITMASALVTTVRTGHTVSQVESGGHDSPFRVDYIHGVFLLATCNICMMLTGWSFQDSSQSKFDVNSGWTSMWIKVSSELVAVLLYVWTLVAPLLFPDREFSGFGKSRA